MAIKGDDFEKSMSELLHSNRLPLLVSPMVLRSRGLGQVDVATISKKNIIVWELKSSLRLGLNQRDRIRAAASFLSQLFSKSVRVFLRIKG